jgi:hypothetical protein
VPSQFIGVWKLVSFERRQVGVAAVVKTYGEHPGAIAPTPPVAG